MICEMDSLLSFLIMIYLSLEFIQLIIKVITTVPFFLLLFSFYIEQKSKTLSCRVGVAWRWPLSMNIYKKFYTVLNTIKRLNGRCKLRRKIITFHSNWYWNSKVNNDSSLYSLKQSYCSSIYQFLIWRKVWLVKFEVIRDS